MSHYTCVCIGCRKVISQCRCAGGCCKAYIESVCDTCKEARDEFSSGDTDNREGS